MVRPMVKFPTVLLFYDPYLKKNSPWPRTSLALKFVAFMKIY